MGKNIIKQEDGMYHVNGKSFKKLVGTRAEVMHDTAYKTSGGLPKEKLVYSKSGRIVSKSKHQTAKSEKRLQKYGYTAKKGHFGPVKMSESRAKRMSRKKSRKNKKCV
jgi:hypothetical protein